MALLAVLSDLHANLSACQAVAEDLRQRSPDAVLVLGDLVGYLTRPNQVVQLAQALGWLCLAGNYDLAVLAGGDQGIDEFLRPGIGPDPRAVFAWTEGAVGPETRRWLAGLPRQRQLGVLGQAILAVHGSPQGVRHYVYPDHPAEEMAAWLDQAGAQVLLMGHTHLPFVRPLPNDCLALNPGSVGKSKDGDPRASYALLETGPPPRAQIIRVDYDLDAEAALLKEAGLPQASVDKLYQGL